MMEDKEKYPFFREELTLLCVFHSPKQKKNAVITDETATSVVCNTLESNALQ